MAQVRDAQVFSASCKAHGGIPDPSGLKCCAASCGQCGGTGCEMRSGGAEMCCGDNLAAADETCGEPACVFRTNPLEAQARAKACESVGGISDPSGLACCPASCGTCGGTDCTSRPGGAESCCGDNIDEANDVCGNPPCLMSAFSDAGPGNEGSEWFRFSSGDVDAWSSRNVEKHGSGDGWRVKGINSIGEYLFSPMEMRDRNMKAGIHEVSTCSRMASLD